MGTQRDFYGPADLGRLDRKIRRERLAVWGLAALTLGLCVLFCSLTTTRNAGRMELYTLVTSCLGGWIVIYLRVFGLQESLHEREHARYLMRSERKTVRGKLGITKERMRIKNSIRFRILTLEEDGKTQRLNAAVADAKENDGVVCVFGSLYQLGAVRTYFGKGDEA